MVRSLRTVCYVCIPPQIKNKIGTQVVVILHVFNEKLCSVGENNVISK